MTKKDEKKEPREDDLSSLLRTPVTMNVSMAAQVTGFNEEYIRRHIREGKLKAAGIPRSRAGYQISKIELEKWWDEELGGGQLFPGKDEEN